MPEEFCRSAKTVQSDTPSHDNRSVRVYLFGDPERQPAMVRCRATQDRRKYCTSASKGVIDGGLHSPSSAMATPKRPAKSSKSWTFKDLNAYNVRIKTVDTEAFFGNSDLPSPSVDSIILQSVNISPDLDVPQDIQTFFDYLHNSTWPANEDRPLFMDEFTQHLLSSVMRFGFTRIRASFPFIMSGQRVKATASISTSTPTRGDSRIRHQIILGQRDRVSLPLYPRCSALLNIQRYLEIEQSLG